MTLFEPTTRTVSPTDEPDLLAGAVLSSLTRPLYFKLSWNLILSLLATALTAGIMPMLFMPFWLRGMIAQHEQQFWHLAEWMRVQTGEPEAIELQKSSKRIRYSNALAILVWVCLLAAVGVAVVNFARQPFSLRELGEFLYRSPSSLPAAEFAAAISGAAVCNWLQLALHQDNMARYVRRFNLLADRLGLDHVPPPKFETGLRPLWIVAALIFALMGAIWGIPVMLAMAAHRRYTMLQSVRVRAALAEQMHALLSRRRPTVRLNPALTVVRPCIRPNCRAPIPSAASFCPRCGTRAAEMLDVVA